jgi:hypothetical protein
VISIDVLEVEDLCVELESLSEPAAPDLRNDGHLTPILAGETDNGREVTLPENDRAQAGTQADKFPVTAFLHQNHLWTSGVLRFHDENRGLRALLLVAMLAGRRKDLEEEEGARDLVYEIVFRGCHHWRPCMRYGLFSGNTVRHVQVYRSLAHRAGHVLCGGLCARRRENQPMG